MFEVDEEGMMNARMKSALAGIGALAAAWVGWGLYVAYGTKRVPYTTVDEFDGIEIRRYPELVAARTTAPDSNEAFRRLYGYITGRNLSAEEIEMTAPVATRGEKIEMTAPVASRRAGDAVEMAFYLPSEYTFETAPRASEADVTLDREEPRTLAVRSFSWYATEARVARNERRLLKVLSEHGVEPGGTPFVMQYNDPWTPPFLRRNEVAVEIG
ncbi:SOUL family heme-binding protein [Halegenticoccus tardaugens]|uniref:SOUL family heme-binding protein n=1 Tax=Halegenticoccus tardaugens TaxID=2071624 RepID=UPI001E5F110D|nr:heme-binding protein [Halegenticoccus tardaugens]